MYIYCIYIVYILYIYCIYIVYILYIYCIYIVYILYIYCIYIVCILYTLNLLSRSFTLYPTCPQLLRHQLYLTSATTYLLPCICSNIFTLLCIYGDTFTNTLRTRRIGIPNLWRLVISKAIQ